MDVRQDGTGIYYASLWAVIWGLTFAAYAVLTFGLFCDGHIVYALDDPMIHLAVAKNLLHGTYGINPGEWSTPSSSLLYPFLLAPLLAVGLGTLSPLLLNLLAAGYAVWLMLEFLWSRIGREPQDFLFGHLASPLLILATSAYALPLTGMEHALHVCATVVAMHGLVVFAESRKVSRSLILSCALLPFLRFEGIALTGVAMLVLLAAKKWRETLQIAAPVVIGLSAWGVFTRLTGLPFMPNSTLIKSEVVQNLQGNGLAGIYESVTNNLIGSWIEPVGHTFYLMLPALIVLAVAGYWATKPARRASKLRMQLSLLAATITLPVAHLMAGHFGWFNRYEVYVVAGVTLGALYLSGPLLALKNSFGRFVMQAAVLALLVYVTLPYAWVAYVGPYASRNMYEQQYQMGRFLTDYFPRRSGVNDIGWVAYVSPNYVLDLWGLGSRAVAEARTAKRYDAAMVSRFVADNEVDAVMIYDSWFERDRILPHDWCRLAVLRSQLVVAGGEAVSFYATRPEVIQPLQDALDRFAPTLPTRDVFERRQCS